MAGQNHPQRPQFGRGGVGDPPRRPVGQHGAATFTAAGRTHDKPIPAIQRTQRNLLRLQKGVALVQRLLVSNAFGGRQIDVNHPHLKRRQHIAGQLFRALAINNRADQFRQVGVAAIAAFRGGGQPQPVGRERKFGNHPVKL